MLSHKRIWNAIDKIAKESGLTPSGLAKKAGLDPTSFNKSKRVGSGGKLRWPSTESLYKILKALGKDLSYFSAMVEPESSSEIKVIGSFQNTLHGFCENSEDNDLENITFPRTFSKDTVAIKIKGYTLDPIYRDGDILVISKKESFIDEDDRIVIKTSDNELLIKRFSHIHEDNVVVKPMETGETESKISKKDIEWMGRIMWVSQ